MKKWRKLAFSIACVYLFVTIAYIGATRANPDEQGIVETLSFTDEYAIQEAEDDWAVSDTDADFTSAAGLVLDEDYEDDFELLTNSILENSDTFEITKTYQIRTSRDDCAVNNTAVNFVSTGVYMHGLYTNNVHQDNYLRFTDIEIPEDAIITDAHLSFTVRDASAKPTTVIITGQTGDGEAFGSTAASFGSRAFTNTYAEMTTPDTISAGTTLNTPNLNLIIDEMRGSSPNLTSYVFKIVGNDKGSAVMRSYDSSSTYAPKLVIEYKSAYAKYVGVISNTYDKAEEYGTSHVIDIGSVMEIGGYFTSALTPAYKQISGFRFQKVDLPPMAEVVDAYLEFTPASNGSAGMVSNMVIKSEIGDAQPYKTTAYNISNRKYGELSVNYRQDTFKTGQIFRTPNLKEIIAENLLYGWQSGQAMAFMIDGDNFLGAVYQGPTTNPPKLVIIYKYGDGELTVPGVSNKFDDLNNVYLNEVSNGTDTCNDPWVELYNANNTPVILSKGMFLGDSDNLDKYEFKNMLIPANGFRVLYLNSKDDMTSANFTLDNTDKLIVSDEIDSEPASGPDYVIINQTYGSGPLDNSGSISHSFIELYNPTGNTISLDGYSLQLQNGADDTNAATEWEKYDFDGRHEIAPHSSFLIRLALAAPSARYVLPNADIDWTTGRILSNRAYSVALVNNQALLSMKITPAEMAGVVDLVGAKNTGKADLVLNYEGSSLDEVSKQKSARRINFQDTDNNAADFESLDYRSAGISAAKLEEVMPRWSGDGPWGYNNAPPSNPVTVVTNRTLTLSAFYDNEYHTIDQLPYYKMQFRETYGRFMDGDSHIVKFDKNGTYNASNNAAIPVMSYSVSKKSGEYANPFDVTVTTDPVNSIMYTLDGTNPGKTSGIPYDGPIHIDQSATLRLYIYNAKDNSGVLAYAYVIGQDGLEYKSKTVTYTIAAGSDDLHSTAAAVNLVDPGLYLHGKFGSSDIVTYLRFTGIDIPEDAIITNAYIAFSTRTASNSPTTFTVSGEIGAGAAFSSSISSVNGRSYTASSVTNTTPDSIAVNKQFTTGDLRDVLNEMHSYNGSLKNCVFKIEGDRKGSYVAQSYEGNRNNAPKLVIEYFSGCDQYIGTSSNIYDSAEEYGVSHVISVGDNMEIGGYFSTSLTPPYKQISGFRFAGVNIPEDAEIVDAYMEYTVATAGPSGAAYASSNMVIKAEAGNPAVYTTQAYNLSDRAYGCLAVKYQQPSFMVVRELIRTPNLKDLIDENRLNGWQSGQALAFWVDGDNFIGSVYKTGTAYAPKLVIKYKHSGKGAFITDAITNPALMQNVYVNEVSGEGTASSKPTWAEIYNANDVPVILSKGTFLSNSDALSKYEFDRLIIPAKGFRVIICDELPELGKDHVNFSLKSSGTVYLSAKNAGGVIASIDSLTYKEHLYNQTYGRITDGSPEVVLFQRDTFSASNNNGQQNYQITVDHDRGVYDTGFTLSISSSNPTATLKYSIDGVTTPSAAKGTIYTGPITIAKSCAVKIYAYDQAGNSGLQAYTYILKDNLKNEVTSGAQWQYKSTISSNEYALAMSCSPIVSVTTDSGSNLVPSADYVQSTFEFIDAHLDNGGHNYFSNAGAQKFGQASIVWYNSGVNVKFHRDYDARKAKIQFFEPLTDDPYPTPNKYTKLQLKEGEDGPQSEVWNLGYLRYSDCVTHMLGIQMGKYDLRTRYVQYFFNGKYYGLKTLREAFSDGQFENTFGDDSSNYTVIDFQDAYFSTGRVKAGDGDPSLLTAIKRTVTNKDFQEFKKYVDIEDFIKFQLLYMFVDTEREAEGILHNDAYSGKGVKMITNINDLDGAFHNDGHTGTGAYPYAGGGGTYRFKWGESISRCGIGGWFGAFSGDSRTNAAAGNLEFKTMVKDQVLAQIGPYTGDLTGAAGAPLSVANVQGLIKQNFEELNNNFAYKVDAAYMGARSSIYQDWLNMQPKVQSQTVDRVQYSLQMWAAYGMAHTLNPVEIINDGSGIVLRNPNNTDVYYTTDGSDPMGPNGVISSSAIKYTASVVLPASGKLTVRPFTTNNWGPISTK